MKTRRETAGHLAAVITIIIWGTTFVSTKVLLEDFPPVDILFYRFLIGLIVLIMVHPHVLTFRSWRQEALFAGAGLCGVTLYFLLENIALTLTYASNAGMIVAVIPMITAVLAHFLLSGEKLEPRFFIGFAAAFTGLALIFFNGQMMLKLNPLGDILAAASAFVWAAYAILMKKISTFGYHRRGRICALLCDMELVGRCAWSGKNERLYLYGARHHYCGIRYHSARKTDMGCFLRRSAHIGRPLYF